LKKLPNGVDGLCKKVNDLGLDFGIWVEPEMVNVDSKLYQEHPDWAMQIPGKPHSEGRNQRILDLTRMEVQDFIIEKMTEVFSSANIAYVKWDMNRIFSDYYSSALSSEQQGEVMHRYQMGLYRCMKELTQRFPKILFEGCSAGGNRFDLGMLTFGPQIWCSDNTDPISRLEIQGNLSYLYPQSTFGAHVSAAPHAQTLRSTPLTTRGNVSFFGCLGYELDLDHLLPVEQKEIKEQIALYKKYRTVFQFGTFSRLQSGWQVQKGKTAIAGVFRKLMHAAPPYEYLRLKGLHPDKRYHFRSRPQELRIGQFGGLVKHVAPVNLNPNGVILRTADRHMTMHDGQQELIASGAALMNGIPLLPLFRGSGYHEKQRTLLDFGSEVYIVEETAYDET
jgi:alpha-galactosidase